MLATTYMQLALKANDRPWTTDHDTEVGQIETYLEQLKNEVSADILKAVGALLDNFEAKIVAMLKADKNEKEEEAKD